MMSRKVTTKVVPRPRRMDGQHRGKSGQVGPMVLRKGSEALVRLEMNEIEANKRREKQKSGLMVFLLVEIADFSYDLAVYLNFVSSEGTGMHSFYETLYFVVTLMGGLATLQLIYVQFKLILQIRREIKEKKLERMTEVRRKMVRAVSDLNEQSLEFQLWESRRSMERMRALVWCAIFEDGMNAILLLYRVHYLRATTEAGMLLIDPFDVWALVFGFVLIGFKLSYLREYNRAKRKIRFIVERLLEDSVAYASILDDFDGVTTDEVNKVVAVRTLLAEELKGFPPHVSSDIFLLFVLRSSKGQQIESCCEKVRSVLKFRSETNVKHQLHDLYLKCAEKTITEIFKDHCFNGQFNPTHCLGMLDNGEFVWRNVLSKEYVLAPLDQIDRYLLSCLELAYLQIYFQALKSKTMLDISYHTIIFFNIDAKISSIGVNNFLEKISRFECWAAGLGADCLNEHVHYINLDSWATWIYNTCQKMMPTSTLMKHSFAYSTKLDALYERIPLARNLDVTWDPRLVDITGRHYLCTLLSDVTCVEVQALQEIENRHSTYFDRLFLTTILNFLRFANHDTNAAIQNIETYLQWRHAEKLVDQSKSPKKDPDVNKYLAIWGFAVDSEENPCVYSLRLDKVDMGSLSQMSIFENLSLCYKFLDHAARTLDETCMKTKKKSTKIKILWDLRNSTEKHEFLIEYFKTQLEVMTSLNNPFRHALDNPFIVMATFPESNQLVDSIFKGTSKVMYDFARAILRIDARDQGIDKTIQNYGFDPSRIL